MNTSISPRQALFKAVFRLLRPLVRILLRNGIPYSAFTDIAKRAYVDVADKEFNVAGKKQTNSRISTITGLSRKEIQRVLSVKDVDDEDDVKRYNRAARVVYGWVHDAEYSDSNGDAAVLSFEKDIETGAKLSGTNVNRTKVNGTKIIGTKLDSARRSRSFTTLVKKYSGDIPPRAIFDELVRVGVVERVEKSKVRLLERAYIPRAGEVEKLALLGRDVAGLINTMDRNIHAIDPKPMFQRKVFYDNLPDHAAEELQQVLANRGQSLLEFLDQWMAAHDRDVNPEVEGKGRHAAGIGIYFFEEEVEVESNTGLLNNPVQNSISQNDTLVENEGQHACDVEGEMS